MKDVIIWNGAVKEMSLKWHRIFLQGKQCLTAAISSLITAPHSLNPTGSLKALYISRITEIVILSFTCTVHNTELKNKKDPSNQSELSVHCTTVPEG